MTACENMAWVFTRRRGCTTRQEQISRIYENREFIIGKNKQQIACHASAYMGKTNRKLNCKIAKS